MFSLTNYFSKAFRCTFSKESREKNLSKHFYRYPHTMAEPNKLSEHQSFPSSQDLWYESATTGIASEQYMVYMIPGNPCIMTYYQPFLSKLSKLLDKALVQHKISAHVGGYTLPGFRLKRGPLDNMKLPASLESQVRNVERQIQVAFKEKVDVASRNEHSGRPKVILVAHSIGTYITHKILRRQAERSEGFLDLDVTGAILICAPVTTLADAANDSIAKVPAHQPPFSYVSDTSASLLLDFQLFRPY